MTRAEVAMLVGIVAFVVMGLANGDLRWSLSAGLFAATAAWVTDIITERRG